MVLLEVDAAFGEAGGQVLRICFPLGALLQQNVQMQNFRISQSTRGLRKQHLATLSAIRTMCDGRLTGDELKSTQFTLEPKFKSTQFTLEPKSITAGEYTVDIDSAGSVALMIQGLLPCALFAKPIPSETRITVYGGTHVPFSPLMEFYELGLLPLLRRMGVDANVIVKKRGFNPFGKGHAHLSVASMTSALKPIDLVVPGVVVKVTGVVASCGQGSTRKDCQKVIRIITEILHKKIGHAVIIEMNAVVDDEPQVQHGSKGKARNEKHPVATTPSSLVYTFLVAQTSTKSILTASVLGSSGHSAKYLGETTCRRLLKSIRGKACVDEHLADNLLIYMALAEGRSRIRTIHRDRFTSQHIASAIHYASLISGAKFKIYEQDDASIIECIGIGYIPNHT